MPQRHWLAHCARAFTAIEVNATFYRFLKPEMLASWRDATPADFPFALKGHRFITHGEKLVGTAALLRRMRDSVQPLAGRVAVVLWQVPQGLDKDLPRLAAFADTLEEWPNVRHAFEFRNNGWFDDATAALMAERRLALCLADGAEWPMWNAVTTDLVYARMYRPPEDNPPRDLDRWAERVRGWADEGRDVHVYFDNDPAGDAPYSAMRLIELTRART